MNEIRLKAFAKINLGLDVVRRRPDGYHEVRMIMQTVRIFDRLTLTRRAKSGITLRTNLRYLPTGADNLAFRAASLLFDEFGIDEGLDIDLEKHIPVAAGLAGGSSDAAAVLFGVNRMFGLGLDTAELMSRGARLGADIPFCVMRGTAIAEGMGEKLTALPPLPDCHILLAKPGFSVSTKFVYENLHVEKIAPDRHPDIDRTAAALKKGDLKGMTACMAGGNLLETVTENRYPVIGEIKAIMNACGALVSMMSGSGPTVFGIFEDRAEAEAAFSALRRRSLAKNIFLTEPYNVSIARR